jgi:hypothetical protein
MAPKLPNLGYACLCATLRATDIFASRCDAPPAARSLAQSRAHIRHACAAPYLSLPHPCAFIPAPLPCTSLYSTLPRDTNKAGFTSRGLPYISSLTLRNARDLLPLVPWNEAHGIRLFRLSSGAARSPVGRPPSTRCHSTARAALGVRPPTRSEHSRYLPSRPLPLIALVPHRPACLVDAGIFPWMSYYTLDELPDAPAIKEVSVT